MLQSIYTAVNLMVVCICTSVGIILKINRKWSEHPVVHEKKSQIEWNQYNFVKYSSHSSHIVLH